MTLDHSVRRTSGNDTGGGTPSDVDQTTDADRALLRDAVRALLADLWPAEDYERDVSDPECLRAVWAALCAQGAASIGSAPDAGGLREVVVVLEELGRAACLAPALAAAAFHLAVGPHTDGTLGARISGGQAIPVLALDGLTGPAGVAVQDERLTGVLDLLEATEIASHLLVPLPDRNTLAVVELDASGVTVEQVRALGAAGLSRVGLDAAPYTAIALPDIAWRDLLQVARVGLAARAHGETARTFEMACEYVTQRQQFGRPVGAFQAVQHKLANSLIAVDGCGLLIRQAAGNVDRKQPDAHLTAAAAFAFASTALRRVSLETHHTFGAIGYAEEHEAPRHFKRVHVDATRLGGARAAREELAAHYLDEGGLVPDIDLGELGNAFRNEVESWLRAHWTPEERAASRRRRHEFGHDYDHEFARLIGETGWIGLSWPEEYGGQARSPRENLAYLQVMERYDAPRAGSPVHSAMIMAHGTPEQRQRFLPEILAGAALHGISYSEPDSGSDLASLRARAVRDGDEYVIDGQKIWTTTYYGEYLLVAARTDPDAHPKHAGISVFMVPSDAPGITKRIIDTMYDGSFANIFFDGVRVPASARLGPENDGWRVLTSALGTERGVVGGGQIVLSLVRLFELLCEELRGGDVARVADSVVRDAVGQLATDLEVARQLMTSCALIAEGGVSPLHEAAMTKVFASELHERFGEAVLDLLGPAATLSAGTPGALADGRFELRLRHSLMWVISLGTNEIQRTLIAQRGLGLPRR